MTVKYCELILAEQLYKNTSIFSIQSNNVEQIHKSNESLEEEIASATSQVFLINP